MRGLRRFKVRGKPAPRFIRSFKILEKRGEVAYQLKLPPQLSDVHDMLHVSQLKKCLCVPERQILMEYCHTRFLRPKPDAHHMYAQDQVVIHTV
jgi:hypothetical protein